MELKLSIEQDLLKRVLQANLDTVKLTNTHEDRMYLLGMIMVAQFSNDIEIQNIIHDAHMFMNGTLPGSE